MSVLADWEIRERGIISPYTDGQRQEGVITSGVSSYGYDIRCPDVFHVFDPAKGAGRVIDPKRFNAKELLHQVGGVAGPGEPTPEPLRVDEYGGRYIVIPPNSFALTHSLERISIPRDIVCVVLGKSTYARTGVIINVTPLEPDWQGHVTLEITNTAPMPLKVYALEGICQLLFHVSAGHMKALEQFLFERLGLTAEADVKAAQERLNELRHQYGCERSYADKGGRYNHQKAAVAFPTVRGQPVKHAGD